nr:hypothetical protein [uncultured Draconibacterium sp.]
MVGGQFAPASMVNLNWPGVVNLTGVSSLDWDYTILLWFLAEALEKNIMINKVEQIIYQLIEPLFSPANLPNSQLNRLLLLTVLYRLKKVFFNINKITSIENINKIISLVDITRLQAELPQKNMSLQTGISGIIILFEQLQCLKGSNSFKEEVDYCRSILRQSLECIPDGINKLCHMNNNNIGISTGISAPIMISTLTY